MSTKIDSEAKLHRHDSAWNVFALKLAALHDLSLELSLADDVDELCRRAVGLGLRVLGFDRIGIWFVDPSDPARIYGSFGTDESGRMRDERGVSYRRSDDSLPLGFYESKEPVYYMGDGPCFDERHRIVGNAEKALALVWDGRTVIGEISVDNLIAKRPIDGGSLELLVRFARIVGYLTSLKRIQAELKLQSSTDELTGVVNRRTVLVMLEKQFGLAARKGESLAVLFCDLDGLKQVNDNLGHRAGDEYIKIACSILSRSIRDSDTIGRLGGDEFLVVLPDCDGEGAAIIEGRIDAAIAEANAEEGEGIGERPFPIAISRGLALNEDLGACGAERTAKALVDLADSRMYEDKRGRRGPRL